MIQSPTQRPRYVPPQMPVSFGNAAPVLAAEKNLALKTSKYLHRNVFSKMNNINLRVGNFSLEDIASRFITVFSVYLPQGYLAAKENKHPMETNIRNAVVFLLTLWVMSFGKSDKMSVNKLFNVFMQPKDSSYYRSLLRKRQLTEQGARILTEDLSKLQQTPKKAVSAFRQMVNLLTFNYFTPAHKIKQMDKQVSKLTRQKQKLDTAITAVIQEARQAGIKPHAVQGKLSYRLLNPLKFNYNVFNMLNRAGLHIGPVDRTKAYWTGLDMNKIDKLKIYLNEIPQKIKSPKFQAAETKAVKQFLWRLNSFKLLSTATITALTVYVIGGLAMKAVYKLMPSKRKAQKQQTPQPVLQPKIQQNPYPANQARYNGPAYPQFFTLPFQTQVPTPASNNWFAQQQRRPQS